MGRAKIPHAQPPVGHRSKQRWRSPNDTDLTIPSIRRSGGGQSSTTCLQLLLLATDLVDPAISRTKMARAGLVADKVVIPCNTPLVARGDLAHSCRRGKLLET